MLLHSFAFHEGPTVKWQQLVTFLRHKLNFMESYDGSDLWRSRLDPNFEEMVTFFGFHGIELRWLEEVEEVQEVGAETPVFVNGFCAFHQGKLLASCQHGDFKHRIHATLREVAQRFQEMGYHVPGFQSGQVI